MVKRENVGMWLRMVNIPGSEAVKGLWHERFSGRFYHDEESVRTWSSMGYETKKIAENPDFRNDKKLKFIQDFHWKQWKCWYRNSISNDCWFEFFEVKCINGKPIKKVNCWNTYFNTVYFKFEWEIIQTEIYST